LVFGIAGSPFSEWANIIANVESGYFDNVAKVVSNNSPLTSRVIIPLDIFSFGVKNPAIYESKVYTTNRLISDIALNKLFIYSKELAKLKFE
jgi:hypothetical protein